MTIGEQNRLTVGVEAAYGAFTVFLNALDVGTPNNGVRRERRGTLLLIAAFMVGQIRFNERREEGQPAVIELLCSAIGSEPAFIGLPRRE